MRGFELVHPGSLADAIGLLDTDDDTVRPFSGGTALMLMMKTGVFRPSRLVHLGRIGDAYSEITASPAGGLRIGAMATLSALEHSPEVIRVAPVVARAMTRLANVRVRNVACVGGNLAHGDPHMDLPPVLAALGGSVSVAGPQGTRDVAVEKLFSGYYETVLGRGELITDVVLPSQRGWSSAYLKCTTRSADDWPALGVAVSLRIEGGAISEARVVVSAATEILTRLTTAESALTGAAADESTFARACEAAAAEAEMVEDARGSADYKTQLLRVYLRRALTQAVQDGAVS
ncbi:FAD binding domain-containing protein [Rhodoplanes roseus]|uniref:Molybdopterin dehydrogenase n=1 Tax=Rhodoplanes roseus TaxID=29409 RepID=A0A327KR07_9BRAD|nr:FAD binding domain-containing protein [Rhodoplanes roseus]RAI40861.1 molybdopterin dehydrogenase [Rhodoplanes roseus]